MVKTYIFIILLESTLLCYALSPLDPLYSALHYYETLHKNQFTHKAVRANMPRLQDQLREIHFTTHSKFFRLMVSPHLESFHSHIQSHSDHPVNFNEFFRGHVFGEEYSDVLVHISQDGLITGSITINSDIYYIEPSDRHLEASHDYHMITYKASDIKSTNGSTSYCTYRDNSMFYDHTHFTQSVTGKRGRLKRQSSAVTVCPIFLVGTFSFFQQFGRGELVRAINYLLFLMIRVDNIYRNTNWVIPNVLDSASPGSKGLEIAGVHIITNNTDNPSYNQDSNRQSEDLLRAFSTSDWSQYCLSHLFIGNTFADSARLGVAYIAYANSFYLGGICSRYTSINGLPFSGNTGVSSYHSSSRLLLLGESVIVTAHEIGHNWGSQHDDVSVPECNPSQDNGGKYLMYPVAQDGLSDNNFLFSNCSIRGVSRVLNTHESDCFTAPSVVTCGNFIIDNGEDCDPGPSGVQSDGDQCCNRNCTFKGNVTCSDTNHDCCSGCRPKPSDAVCLNQKAGNRECLANNTCNGQIMCPTERRYVAVNTSCGFMGVCMASSDSAVECKQFCEQQDLQTCHCTGDDQCRICCRDGTTSCKPYLPLNDLPDESFCEGGTCQLGVCVLSDPDLVTFLFDLFSDFNTNAILRFLYENIVATVIIISLCLWIPVSIAVHVFDIWWEKRRKEKKETKEKDVEKHKLLNEDVDSPRKLSPLSPSDQMKFHDRDPEHDPITQHVPDYHKNEKVTLV